jgi:hypothetical protein|tara:strand:- start:656 stop:820 length:165 start_codon:yes stop_codon:yes gene_type:complete
MEIGDRVTWNGHIGTLVSIDKPRCKCKGQGHYKIDVGGVINKIPIKTKLVLYEQ